MSWNHRITRRRVPPDGEHLYEIREVYYDGAGKAMSWTEHPIAPSGETWQELFDELSKMSRVVTHPILDIDTGEDIPLR
jgi:hypothetical protein